MTSLPAPGVVRILDGGLATALEQRGHDLADDLWSARLLRDDPREIVATHLAFYRAGADIAISASYQASVGGFATVGLSRVEAERLIASSVVHAREAAEAAEAEDDVRRLVAASVGPYGAVLADGSEYTGDYGADDAALREFHASRLELLAGAGPDLLAIETVPSEQEAVVLLSLLAELDLGVPAWLSLTCADESHTRRGDDVSRVFGMAASVDDVVAVGVNCLAPVLVGPLVEAAVAASGKPAVAYPNSGESFDAREHRWSGDGVAVSAALARVWVTAGATHVGGCCRVGVDDIAALSSGLRTTSSHGKET